MQTREVASLRVPGKTVQHRLRQRALETDRAVSDCTRDASRRYGNAVVGPRWDKRLKC